MYAMYYFNNPTQLGLLNFLLRHNALVVDHPGSREKNR